MAETKLKTETDKFTVSVILTVYNRKRLVTRAIDSILKQTYKNYEVIIVDDGSTDNLEEILFPILKEHSNFKYIRHSNRKTAYSLNTGILNSTGKYITFLDSDDEYMNEHLKTRINFFKKHKKVDLIYSSATLVGDEKDFYVPDARNTSKKIHINDCVIGATFFGKKKVFTELEGFKDMYSYDSDFHKRAKKKFKVKKIDVPTYIYYRNHPDSVINQFNNLLSDE
jgi:glycosyltransferase involved in cell wall biosynthesis